MTTFVSLSFVNEIELIYIFIDMCYFFKSCPFCTLVKFYLFLICIRDPTFRVINFTMLPNLLNVELFFLQ